MLEANSFHPCTSAAFCDEEAVPTEDSEQRVRIAEQVAKRRIKKEKPKDSEAGPDLEELALELEAITNQLKTSTVTYSRERLKGVVAKMRLLKANKSS